MAEKKTMDVGEGKRGRSADSSYNNSKRIIIRIFCKYSE
jgi:hypothetical protein